ncbi:MAG: hypothetical protein M1816_006781 [Peltula sp. TS41687]|nr:MAG: hypothetical protein M1816_006781 [Peltula sp. TS41687]
MATASAEPALITSAHVSSDGLQSYFGYSTDTGLIHAHIVFMVIAWIFVLPLGLALSIARSRIAIPVHCIFAIANALGLLTGTIYNNRTPDLYPNNAHHKLGWWITWIFITQAIMGLVGLISSRSSGQGSVKEEQTSSAYIPISVEAMAQLQRIHSTQTESEPRLFSGDSGQGTERASSSLKSDSLLPTKEHPDGQLGERPDDSTADLEFAELLEHQEGGNQHTPFTLIRYLMRYFPTIISRRMRRISELLYDIIDRLLLPLGFVTFSTGVVTYGGIFRGGHVFNGLAHFTKGGIFVWYGFLTLGRWMGCFADFGWAWNVKPSRALVGARKASVPSAEFVESFVIFLYGVTNVFLEHLAAWGGAWTAQDLEHVSISVMFFGGGLCGMLIESKGLRDLLNSSIMKSRSPYQMPPSWNHDADDPSSWNPPRTYKFSMNPLPGLIILLLGLMMSSHHQSSMVSTMVHKQWGMLLVGFALARAVTYLIMYLSPPSSLFPSRPPSELVSSFCLISGGLIFMASNKDTVAVMEAYALDAMFVFTVTMGLTAFIMAWSMLVVGVKGWATRRTAVR